MADICDPCALCGQPITDSEHTYEDARTGQVLHLSCVEPETVNQKERRPNKLEGTIIFLLIGGGYLIAGAYVLGVVGVVYWALRLLISLTRYLERH